MWFLQTKVLYWGIIEESSGFLIVLHRVSTGTETISCLYLSYYCLYKMGHINHKVCFSLCALLADAFEVGQ